MLNTSCVPGIVSGAGNTVMSKQEKTKHCQPRVYSLMEEEESEDINYKACQKIINTLQQSEAGKGVEIDRTCSRWWWWVVVV